MFGVSEAGEWSVFKGVESQLVRLFAVVSKRERGEVMFEKRSGRHCLHPGCQAKEDDLSRYRVPSMGNIIILLCEEHRRVLARERELIAAPTKKRKGKGGKGQPLAGYARSW